MLVGDVASTSAIAITSRFGIFRYIQFLSTDVKIDVYSETEGCTADVVPGNRDRQMWFWTRRGQRGQRGWLMPGRARYSTLPAVFPVQLGCRSDEAESMIGWKWKRTHAAAEAPDSNAARVGIGSAGC